LPLYICLHGAKRWHVFRSGAVASARRATSRNRRPPRLSQRTCLMPAAPHLMWRHATLLRVTGQQENARVKTSRPLIPLILLVPKEGKGATSGGGGCCHKRGALLQTIALLPRLTGHADNMLLRHRVFISYIARTVSTPPDWRDGRRTSDASRLAPVPLNASPWRMTRGVTRGWYLCLIDSRTAIPLPTALTNRDNRLLNARQYLLHLPICSLPRTV